MPSRIVPWTSVKFPWWKHNYGAKNGKWVLFTRAKRDSLTNLTELRKTVSKESEDGMRSLNCFFFRWVLRRMSWRFTWSYYQWVLNCEKIPKDHKSLSGNQRKRVLTKLATSQEIYIFFPVVIMRPHNFDLLILSLYSDRFYFLSKPFVLL